MDLDKYLEGQSMQRPPFFESDHFIYWKNRFETDVKAKDLDLWHIILNGNSQVKDSKIDLLVKQYEQFTILEEESIDSGFARFNTIITSLKALDEGTLKSSLEERVNLLGNQEKKRSHSDKEMRRNERVTRNVLDAVIQIISLAIVQNHFATKIKRPSLEVIGAIAKMMPKEKPTMKLVSWLNRRMRAYCDAQGITHNFSAPRTPQSNGVVERKNRTLQEMSRTMLNEQSIPQNFWCNAVDTSTYILNRILIRPILGITPYEIFRGYSQNSKAYVVLNKHTIKVKESLNVTFDESPPPTKLSPLVDDDVGEEEAIRKNTKIVNTNSEYDESIEVDEIINIKESKNHPLDQYIKKMLKKFGLEDSKPTKTLMSMEIKLTKDDEADSVDSSKYQGVTGSLLYLTASRPDIMFSVCLCARFQENPKTTHLEVKQTALAISMIEAEYVSDRKAYQQALWMKQALIDYDIRLDDIPIMCDNKGAIDLSTKMPSEYQQDYKKTRAYAPKIYNDPNMSDTLRDIYRTLESRYVHEGRTIDPSFYNDLSDDSVAKFTAIGFDCLLSLDEQICPRFIFEFYKTLKLERDSNNHFSIQFIINNHHFNLSLAQFAELTYLPNQGICIYSDAWGLDELEKTLEQIEPYNSRLPALDDIRNLIHRRTVHEKIDKEGNTIHKLPNQIKTNELFDHLRPCELVIRENVYSAIGNRDHTQAVIALMLYCLENRQPFNLAYFIIRRMYFFRDRRDKVLPYGMILTRLFKNLKANMAQGSFDERYKLVPRKMSSLKAKQPKKPPPKRTRNVGKSKRTQLTTSSLTESPPPLIMKICLAPNFPLGHIVELLRTIPTCPRSKGRHEGCLKTWVERCTTFAML
ncbi:copia protein [Tanacetum coccineum]